MAIVFAAITPHPIALVPAIGKEEGLSELKKTIDAFAKLEQDLYLSKPDVICIISPHEGIFEDAFVINAHTSYDSNFTEFGDMTTLMSWKGSPDLAANIRTRANGNSAYPVTLISETKLGHGTSVPLFMLTKNLPQTTILPIGFSGRSREEHDVFGNLLHEVFMDSTKRIAIISSGDLSHTLTKGAPGGFHEEGATFDAALLSILAAHDIAGLHMMDESVIAAAQECGYRSLLILCGALGEMRCTFEKYAYEHPFGVGYLTGIFHID